MTARFWVVENSFGGVSFAFCEVMNSNEIIHSFFYVRAIVLALC